MKVLAILQIRNFTLLRDFESQALNILRDYQGRLLNAFETVRNDDGSGEEVHLLEFPDRDSLARYQSDPRLQALQELRQQAISGTELRQALKDKDYQGRPQSVLEIRNFETF